MTPEQIAAEIAERYGLLYSAETAIASAIQARDDEARKVIADFHERYRHYSSTDPDLIKAAEAWLETHPKTEEGTS